MKISLSLSDSARPERKENGAAVFSMGSQLPLSAKFANDGASTLSMDSPNSSQEVLLWLKTPRDIYRYIVNQSRMDKMGEITAPPKQRIELAAGESFTLGLNLEDYNVDRWFEPGVYEVYLQYLGEQSPPVRFGIEFSADSVPHLAEMFLDSPDAWMRERSFEWLQKLPDKPPLVLVHQTATRPAPSPADAQNRYEVRAFLNRWPTERQTHRVRVFFESSRIGIPAH